MGILVLNKQSANIQRFFKAEIEPLGIGRTLLRMPNPFRCAHQTACVVLWRQYRRRRDLREAGGKILVPWARREEFRYAEMLFDFGQFDRPVAPSVGRRRKANIGAID